LLRKVLGMLKARQWREQPPQQQQQEAKKKIKRKKEKKVKTEMLYPRAKKRDLREVPELVQ
jgi:hypothetical protein